MTHEVDEAALDWFVTLRDGGASHERRQEFDLWLTADPEHRAAWAELVRLWGDLGLVAQAPARKVPLRRMAIAATILICAGLGWQAMPQGIMADHRTAVAERQTVRLADGSTVDLGPLSALDVTFTPQGRGVTLLRGEGFFTVAKDPARPFIVHAGAGMVTVLGTAFDVRMTDRTHVTVTESTVAVSAGDDAAQVAAGQAVEFDADGVSAVRPADPETDLAWRQGRLVFIDAPLREVVADLNRYRHDAIRIIGSDLGMLRVTAAFDADHADTALEGIAGSLGLRITGIPGLPITLLRK